MLSENAILAVASTSIISLTAMATMVTYLMLRESSTPLKAFVANASEALEVEVVTLDNATSTTPCAYPGWIKDGICDLLNNFEACDYDGGDCNPACARPDLAGDGKCDVENNTAGCEEDGQDCAIRKITLILDVPKNDLCFFSDLSHTLASWRWDLSTLE